MAGVGAVVPARISIISSSADGAESTNVADGSAVIWGVKVPREALGVREDGKPRISSKSSAAVGGRGEAGRFWLAFSVALVMNDERGRWTPRVAISHCQYSAISESKF